MTSTRPHRALSVILFVVAAIEGLAGLVLLFGTNWMISMMPGLTMTSFSLILIKAIGIVALGLGYLLCVTARDPARYVAVVDTFVFLALAAAALSLYGLYALGLGTIYPGTYLIARAVVQIVFAAVLIALRPRSVLTASSPTG